MAAIPYLYKRLRAQGVPETQAQLFSDQDSAITGEAVADLAGGATLPTTVTKVNELLAALRAAGIIAEE